MGGGGGSTGKGKQTTTVRYAPYIEAHHTTFLDRIETLVSSALDDSPYEAFGDVDFGDGFFGAGYVLSSFPSLYDMFGKFMAGLDIEILYDQMFESTVNNETINNVVSAEADLLGDHIDVRVSPKYQTGMRDINAVLSSSYMIGKANIAEAQTKAIEKFSSELKYRMIPIAVDRWKTHLSWNQGVVQTYADLLRLYMSAKIDSETFNRGLAVKKVLWPFSVMEYQRAALGAMQGASNAQASVAGDEPSKLMGALGGAMSGASAGFAVGGPYGAIAGGVIGAASSFL